MKTRGPSLFLFSLPLVVACGASGAAGPAQQPANAPTSDVTTTAATEPKKAEPAPEAAKPEAAPASETAATPAPAAEPVAEPCPQDWVCLRVPLDGKGKIEKRATRLIGDPKIDTTWSANVDTTRPGKFDSASKPVEIALRLPASKPGQHLAQVVLKANGREIMLDKHEGEELTYVGVIAAEKEGENAFLVDLRYMK